MIVSNINTKKSVIIDNVEWEEFFENSIENFTKNDRIIIRFETKEEKTTCEDFLRERVKNMLNTRVDILEKEIKNIKYKGINYSFCDMFDNQINFGKAYTMNFHEYMYYDGSNAEEIEKWSKGKIEKSLTIEISENNSSGEFLIHHNYGNYIKIFPNTFIVLSDSIFGIYDKETFYRSYNIIK
jgi:hypothetical protein